MKINGNENQTNSIIESKLAKLNSFVNLQDYLNIFFNDIDLYSNLTPDGYNSLPKRVLNSSIAKVLRISTYFYYKSLCNYLIKRETTFAIQII